MTNFEIRIAGVDPPVSTGNIHHIPRIGESIKLQDLIFKVVNIIWEFDHKYKFGSLATIVVEGPPNAVLTWSPITDSH